MVAHRKLLPPQQLTRLWEDGRLTRREYQEAMAVHAKLIIEEMVEARQNPVAAYFEHLLNQRAADQLKRRHGEGILRELFEALAEVPDFPPAIYLWNAGHWHVPLHCFVRTRSEPVFRVKDLHMAGTLAKITVEYGSNRPRHAIRETVVLRRNRIGAWLAESRSRLP